jgi:hypothetical protein
MIDSGTVPRVGQVVGVRQRLYLVDQVVDPVNADVSTLVQLSCVDDGAQGQPLEVLWERELDARIVSDEARESIANRGFDPYQRFAAKPVLVVAVPLRQTIQVKAVRQERDALEIHFPRVMGYRVRHSYFLGANDPRRALKTTLKAEIDEDSWASLRSDTSPACDKQESGRVAVKVINHLGDEVMKVFRVTP